MKRWLRNKIAMWLTELLVNYLVIGAHCGCCGAWIKDSIVPYYWRIDICNNCKEEANE